MNTQIIQMMLDYNYWATARILRMAEQLTEADYFVDTGHSYRSVHGTLVHVIWAENVWRRRLQGEGFDGEYAVEDLPTLAIIKERWLVEEEKMRAYLATLTDADLLAVIRYKNSTTTAFERTTWQCLYHLVNHGTQHRSEVADMLTRFGSSPGDIDFILYLNTLKGQ